VVVTRPVKQAGPLCQLIEIQGGKAITFPSLEILAVEQQEKTASIATRLHLFDMAIFISVNAVEGAARLIGDTLPGKLKLAAVGNSSCKAVEQQWQQTVLCPDSGANSEALLAMTEFQQLKGRKILIFRGQGGRELLAQTLTQRGATVEYVEVYRRTRPAGNLEPLQKLSPAINLITATSNENLQNLYDMADNDEQRAWLLSKQLIVISERTAQLAEQLGFRHPAIISTQSNDLGLVTAMQTWHNKQNNNH
jgi:uroporphyrinogen-III synthase